MPQKSKGFSLAPVPKDIDYVAEPTPELFHRSPKFVRGIMGPYGSGKSSACVMEMYTRSCEQNPYNNVRMTRWAVIRATYPELRDTTIRTFQEWIPEKILPISKQPPYKGSTWLTLPDKTILNMEVIFMALDDEEAVNKLKSLDLTGVWINEAVEVPRAVLDNARARVDRFPSPRMGGTTWNGVIMDTNPCDDEHWWYNLAEVMQPENYQFFRQPPAVIKVPPADGENFPTYIPNQGQIKGVGACENVGGHNKGYGYWMNLVEGSDEEWIKVYLMGDYGTVVAGKPVMSEYNDSLHCAKKDLEPYRGLPLLLSWDFGLTPACLINQVSPRGQLRILEELCCEDGGIRSFAGDVVKPHLMSQYPGMRIQSVGDPAGGARAESDETTCLQELERLGIPTDPAPSNNFIARREALAGYMTKLVDGQPGFLISPTKAPRTRKGLMGRYRYRKMRLSTGDRYTDKPEKNEYSHPCEAAQYAALASQGPITMKPERPGMPSRSSRRRVVVTSSAGWT